MIGIPGIAARILGALARNDVNVMMISQASSEHTICLVFRDDVSQRAQHALESELELEIQAKRIQSLELVRGLAIVAVIGEHMRGAPGISGRLFGALGKDGINVLAISQGSSECNISIVVHDDDERTAVNAIHSVFLRE